jgi:hypothetical protein
MYAGLFDLYLPRLNARNLTDRIFCMKDLPPAMTTRMAQDATGFVPNVLSN